jgi:hypothetical protein
MPRAMARAVAVIPLAIISVAAAFLSMALQYGGGGTKLVGLTCNVKGRAKVARVW